jgi:hypothetical protein
MDEWVLDKKPCPGKTFSVVDQMECPALKLKLYTRMYGNADMRWNKDTNSSALARGSWLCY